MDTLHHVIWYFILYDTYSEPRWCMTLHHKRPSNDLAVTVSKFQEDWTKWPWPSKDTISTKVQVITLSKSQTFTTGSDWFKKCWVWLLSATHACSVHWGHIMTDKVHDTLRGNQSSCWYNMSSVSHRGVNTFPYGRTFLKNPRQTLRAAQRKPQTHSTGRE